MSEQEQEKTRKKKRKSGHGDQHEKVSKEEKKKKREAREENEENADADEETTPSFSAFNLDDRLMKEKLIPLVLEGADVVVRARTGSGKTAAFAVPILSRVLQTKWKAQARAYTYAVVLTPTKELANQVASQFTTLLSGSSREDIRVLDLSPISDSTIASRLLADCPDIVIATPSGLVTHWSSELAEHLQVLVLDEADLLLSFGYEKELTKIAAMLPPSYQSILTSATLPDDVTRLKQLIVRRNPITLKLKEAQLPDATQLTQYHIRCTEDERFVLIYALLKLRLIRGATIIFVASTDRSYRLRLFLEQVGISACVLNSEMPMSSRCHVVRQFNEGRYQHVIAADVGSIDAHADDAHESTGKKRKKRRRKEDAESGVSRGIDFHHVANVINFDFPVSVDAYIHRVGRTARGWNKGTALSFVTDEDLPVLEDVQRVLAEQLDGHVLKPYEFRMEELDGFRYRAQDVLRAVTTTAVTEARLAEIKAEALRSRKLAGYFARNPREHAALVHDKALHTVRVHSAAIRDVPEYIVPVTLRGSDYRPASGVKRRGQKSVRKWVAVTAGRKKHEKKMRDPLQSFTF